MTKKPANWPLTGAYGTAATAMLLGLWRTVVIITGGTLPLLGIESEGKPLLGLAFLVVVTPLFATIAFWTAFIPLALLAKIRGRW
ncbi:hypothetical protein ACFYOD_39020 [Streptomyces sp. NPDC006703]|uniref:hypothetical protein n=1 Tax=Streptomyces sp. NPDC006703 TaxID=3364759 RepID=UPI0036CA005D